MDQRLVGEALARNAVREAVEPLQGVPLHIALVEPESELANVTIKVLLADMVERTVDASLQQCPNGFDAVGRNVVANVLMGDVIDGFMLVPEVPKPAIATGIVGVDHGSRLNVIEDREFKGYLVVRSNRHALDASAGATLAHPEDDGFTNAAGLIGLPFRLVLIGFFAADISFIDFDDPAQLSEVVAARLAKPPEHEPSRLLGNADLLGELHRRDALASGHDEVHRVDPLVQRDVAALHNRAGADGEILLALITAVEAALAGRDPLAEAAYRTTRAVRPQAALKPHPRRLRVGNQFEKLEGRNRALAHGVVPSTGRDYRRFLSGSKVYNYPEKQ